MGLMREKLSADDFPLVKGLEVHDKRKETVDGVKVPKCSVEGPDTFSPAMFPSHKIKSRRGGKDIIEEGKLVNRGGGEEKKVKRLGGERSLFDPANLS